MCPNDKTHNTIMMVSLKQCTNMTNRVLQKQFTNHTIRDSTWSVMLSKSSFQIQCKMSILSNNSSTVRG